MVFDECCWKDSQPYSVVNCTANPTLVFPQIVDDFILRSLYHDMLSRMPPDISVDDDLVPGGDIRVKGNSWLRSAFKATELESVPRETQFRLAVGKIMAKRKVGPSD